MECPLGSAAVGPILVTQILLRRYCQEQSCMQQPACKPPAHCIFVFLRCSLYVFGICISVFSLAFSVTAMDPNAASRSVQHESNLLSMLPMIHRCHSISGVKLTRAWHQKFEAIYLPSWHRLEPQPSGDLSVSIGDSPQDLLVI